MFFRARRVFLRAPRRKFGGRPDPADEPARGRGVAATDDPARGRGVAATDDPARGRGVAARHGAAADPRRGRSPRPRAGAQVHTYRLQGHSPADPEHERGRKAEKKWARAEADPLKIFEATERLDAALMDARKKKASAVVKDAVTFAKASPPPPRELAKELEFPDPADTDYNLQKEPADSAALTKASVDPEALKACEGRIAELQAQAKDPGLNIGDALNLAILEEMVRDPRTTIHAEDLQAGSSYDIPRMTQQTFGALRAADEIIDEGHFLGKALGEGMNGYRPIVELMNANFGIYGMAELSSAGNTHRRPSGGSCLCCVLQEDEHACQNHPISRLSPRSGPAAR